MSEATTLETVGILDRARASFRRLFSRPTVRSSHRGETAETVSRVLDELRADGFLVLHGRRLPDRRGGRIDHVVVGPAGVYTVHVERFDDILQASDGALMVDEVERSALLRTRREQATAIERLLSPVTSDAVTVTPVLCFLDMAKPLRWEHQTPQIVPVRSLASTVSRGRRLDPDVVIELSAALPDHLPAS